jgi:hypothetical protein
MQNWKRENSCHCDTEVNRRLKHRCNRPAQWPLPRKKSLPLSCYCTAATVLAQEPKSALLPKSHLCSCRCSIRLTLWSLISWAENKTLLVYPNVTFDRQREGWKTAFP